MSREVLIRDAVYRAAAKKGDIAEGDYLSYRGTTGRQAGDQVVGFEFYNVSARAFVKVSVDDLAAVIGLD